MYQQLFTCTWHFYSQGAVYQRKCSCTFTSCSVLTDNKVNCVFHTHVVCCVFIQSVDEQLWSLRLKTLSFKSGLLSKQNPKPCCLVVGLTPPVVRGGTFSLNSFFNLSRQTDSLIRMLLDLRFSFVTSQPPHLWCQEAPFQFQWEFLVFVFLILFFSVKNNLENEKVCSIFTPALAACP